MFGFLKNKLKEWVDKAKDTLKPEEVETKVEKKIEEKPKKEKPTKEAKAQKKSKSEKPKKEKKSKEKKEEVKEIIVIPEIKPEEDGTAIQIETELEDGVPKDIMEEELKEKIEEEKPKKSFLSKIFGKKEEKPEVISREDTVKETLETIEKEEKENIPEEKSPTFFEKIRSTFIYKITEDDFNEIFSDLEMLLLESNVALEVVEEIKSRLSQKLINKEIKKDDLEKEIKKELKSTLYEILIDPDDPLDAIKMKKEKPFVILFFGINGTGKTTSIAKMTHLLKSKGFSVALAAADTFRAASIEQISEHAKRLDVHVIKQDYGSDPAAIGFDAIKYAKNHNIDVVLIDTAGRMHTKTHLLAEMEKICRVTNPDLKIFVAESIAGNDATEQARAFHESINIDGSILSKADVDEKGGTIISVSYITHKPIFYLGTGQEYKDLKLFNKEEFIENLGL